MGAAYFGWRPTFDTDRVFLEVFLLDFDGDLYGHELAVEFVDMIRPDRKFYDLEALVAQMKRDCDNIRQLLQKDAGVAAGLPLLTAQMSGRLYEELR
jgi:riboflavin kinase/FMN adenylyltransferase